MTDTFSDLEKNLDWLLRTFLGGLPQANIPTKLMAGQWSKEIQSTARVDELGQTFAADQYTLSFHPEDFQVLGDISLKDQEKFSKAFASILRKVHYSLALSPHIAFSTDPLLPRSQLRVIAWHSSDPTGKADAPISGEDETETFPQGAFLVVRGSEHFTLEKPVVNIGRRLDNHLVLDDSRVSRKHAQIRAKAGQFYLIDLHSTSGTLLNGERVEEAGLKPGDVIKMATIEMIYGEDTAGPPEVAPRYAPPFEPETRADDAGTSELSTLEMEGKTKEIRKLDDGSTS